MASQKGSERWTIRKPGARLKSTLIRRRSGAQTGTTQLAIGLMSGTSHDGISAALVKLTESVERPRCELLGFATYPYSDSLRKRLLAATDQPDDPGYVFDEASGTESFPGGASYQTNEFSRGIGTPSTKQELSSLNFLLGRALGQAALKLMRKMRVQPADLCFIASHGHTFFHLPPSRARQGQVASTLQLGEPAVIAALTGVPVVADFRPMDIAVGGEGAPLAPLAHVCLFSDPGRARVVQNIGGIANATYLPAAAKPDDKRVFAFDTGPGNVLIDAVMSKLSNGRAKMDRDGRMAARGNVCDPLLRELMSHPYFARKPPKSTGREEFGLAFADRVLSQARRLALPAEDIIATLTALTARSIADALRRFVLPCGAVDEMILTGGGAHNRTLRRMLAAELDGISVITADDLGVNGDAIEAIAFAILGYEMLCGRAGNIPSVTGAKRKAVLGKLTLPPTPGTYCLISALLP